MNMQIHASAFKAVPAPKTIEEIDSDVCDLRKRAQVLMSLIESFEGQMELAHENAALEGIDLRRWGFDLIAFQANEVCQGLKMLEDAMEDVAVAS